MTAYDDLPTTHYPGPWCFVLGVSADTFITALTKWLNDPDAIRVTTDWFEAVYFGLREFESSKVVVGVVPAPTPTTHTNHDEDRADDIVEQERLILEERDDRRRP